MRRRILIADDQPKLLERVSELIATEHDVVGAVGDGDAAVAAAESLHPDLVILDISMPGMNGFEAARRISAHDPAPRIMFLSVHEEADFLEAARQAGAVGYVLKRSIAGDLLPAIRLVLDGHAVFPTTV
jgi:DNA-binding NarL/FixJ family response regulator